MKKVKNLKVRHIYTVVRESTILARELNEEIEFFQGAMKDETGEYLYGGGGFEEISIAMHVSKDNGKTWEKVDDE
jgi:Neuraminidase (sialidase)